MTPAELVVERVKDLTEAQAQMVLAYIDGLSDSPRLSASDLMRLPPAHRRAILEAQAAKAEVVYRRGPDLICEDAEAPQPYA